jgi:23S rRNA pseudouridine955/2504/2580 synthase
LKNIAVLFENDECLVLNKPAGLAVQGGEGVGASLDTLLAAEYVPRPLLVHRLDRDTSGIILVAKTKEAAALFSGIFARRDSTLRKDDHRGHGGSDRRSANAESTEEEKIGMGVQKQYLAICAGCPKATTGIIETELEVRGAARKAITFYKCLSSGEFSLLELELGTGRMHQIRRHLASIGNPILGDDKYGNFPLNKKLRKERGLKRLLLHAGRLLIPEELCGFPLDVSAPLPEYFEPFVILEKDPPSMP